MKAGLYNRISDDATGQGLGVERQEQENRALAQRLGWDVVESFTDNDISAYSGKRRPRYEALVEAIEAGQVSAVVCFHPDRLTRSPKELEHLIDLLQEHHVEIATVTAGTYDLTTGPGRMAARIVGAVARGESDQKSARLRSQRRQAAEKGLRHGGMRPYGFAADGVNHDPLEADLLRQAARSILDGGSLSEPARRLGKSRAHLRRILLAPRIAGLRQHHGEVVGQAEWEPIISRAEWEQLRATLADPRRRNTQPARSYLLANLVVALGPDGSVERKMVSRPDHGRRTYITASPKDRSVSADLLERLTTDALLARYDDVTVAADPAEADIEAATAVVVALEADLDELVQVRGSGQITLREYLALRQPIAEALEAARAAIPTRSVPAASAEWFAVAGELRRRWPTMSFAQRRAAVRHAIEWVGIKPSGPRRSAFDPDRVVIRWR